MQEIFLSRPSYQSNEYSRLLAHNKIKLFFPTIANIISIPIIGTSTLQTLGIASRQKRIQRVRAVAGSARTMVAFGHKLHWRGDQLVHIIYDTR